MRIVQFQKDIINGRIVLPVCILLTLLLRLHAGIDWLDINNVTTLVFQIVISILLLHIEHTFTIVRSRTVLPMAVYLMITGTYLPAFADPVAAIISFCFILALGSFFASYQRKDAQAQAFNISFILAGCSLLWAPAILFIPLSWLTLYSFRSINLRSFVASFMGIFLVSLFVFCYGIYKEDLNAARDLLPTFDATFHFGLEGWTAIELTQIAFTILLALFSFIYFSRKIFAERIRGRAFLRFLYTFILAISFLMVFLSGDRNILFSLLALPSSLVIAHYFSLSVNKFTAYVAIVSIFFYIATYFLSFYAHSSNVPAWIDSISIF